MLDMYDAFWERGRPITSALSPHQLRPTGYRFGPRRGRSGSQCGPRSKPPDAPSFVKPEAPPSACASTTGSTAVRFAYRPTRSGDAAMFGVFTPAPASAQAVTAAVHDRTLREFNVRGADLDQARLVDNPRGSYQTWVVPGDGVVCTAFTATGAVHGFGVCFPADLAVRGALVTGLSRRAGCGQVGAALPVTLTGRLLRAKPPTSLARSSSSGRAGGRAPLRWGFPSR